MSDDTFSFAPSCQSCTGHISGRSCCIKCFIKMFDRMVAFIESAGGTWQ